MELITVVQVLMNAKTAPIDVTKTPFVTILTDHTIASVMMDTLAPVGNARVRYII